MPIYFIQAGPGGAVKIGFANDLRSRFTAIQTHQAVKLALLHAFRGTKADEKAVQTRFRQHHIRGEWFEPAPEVLAADVGLEPVPNTQSLVAPIPRSVIKAHLASLWKDEAWVASWRRGVRLGKEYRQRQAAAKAETA